MNVVMLGYRGHPEKTAEALDADGRLHTGDIARFDEDGDIAIVDRKKEITMSAAGKNMSPANIESTMKGAGPIIGHLCVIADRRPYTTALVVLDGDFAPALAARSGIEGTSVDELPRVEQIKKFTVIPGDWAPGGDQLTPTLKRKPIHEKYEAEIEAMYAAS